MPYQLLRQRVVRGVVESEMDPQVDQPNMATYKIVQLTKIEKLFNSAIKKHAVKNCEGNLMFDDTREVQWGVVWIERLKCNTCSFQDRVL